MKLPEFDISSLEVGIYGLNEVIKSTMSGTISAEVSHQVSRTNEIAKKDASTTFSISFRSSLEAIGKLFVKK